MSGSNNGTVISKEAAKEMIQLYQENNPTSMKHQLFDGSLVQNILDETGVDAIRIYLGETDGGDFTLILVGVDASGNDLCDLMVVDFGTVNVPTSSYFS